MWCIWRKAESLLLMDVAGVSTVTQRDVAKVVILRKWDMPPLEVHKSLIDDPEARDLVGWLENKLSTREP